MIILKLWSVKCRLYIIGLARSCYRTSVLGFHLESVEHWVAFQHVFNVNFAEARQFETGCLGRDIGGGLFWFACFH